MSEVAEQTRGEATDPQARLRDALAALVAPTANPVEIAEALDDAVGAAARVAMMAKQPANSLEGDLRRALVVTIGAGDAATLFAAVRIRLDQLEAECKAMAEAAERALSDAMHATGEAEVACDTHVAKPKRATQRVEITDPSKLPLDAFTTPKAPVAAPSKEIIRAKLLTGQVCDGAQLVDADPAINITAKKGRGR